MQLVKGNMWDVLPDLTNKSLFCVTTNAYRRVADGSLVMGKGIALEATERYPGIDKVAGEFVTRRIDKLKDVDDKYYGVAVITPDDFPAIHFNLGLVQVKHNFRDNATLYLIRRSVKRLIFLANHVDVIHCNMPGTGNGHLDRKEVLPIVEALPDNVTIWEYTDA